MLENKKLISCLLLALFSIGVFAPVQAFAAGDATAATASAGKSGGSLIDRLFSLIFDGILGPILGLFGSSDKPSSNNSKVVKPMPSKNSAGTSGSLNGKVIVVDPGHGGHNPGAVANGVQEADVNLAISTLLKDKLQGQGAKVVMTRQSDKAVASNTKSLGPELQARVDIAEKNKADLFVSVHANSNPNTSIAGAMTFYPQNKSPKLAQAVQTSLVTQTQAVDKGVSPATFYVLRNTNMPSILVETGFLTNSREAAQLAAAPYQEKVAEGIFSGIVRYLQQG